MNAALKISPFSNPVFQTVTDATELRRIASTLGLSSLPDDLLQMIRRDLLMFNDELSGNFSYVSETVLKRRQSIVYWFDTWKQHLCSTETLCTVFKHLEENGNHGFSA